ncbi:MAG: site-2 protease family protein [Firmicutes bacterium]|nr:site-2 protease family protein [Bacillota bacterium]
MPELNMLILAGPLILFSLVVHEFAHGYTSVKLGDPTPRWQGRLTLNPLAHLDPLGTLMLILTIIRGVGFGWAKPVQINPTYYKNPLKGSMLVACAGPASNLLLALLFGLLFRLLNLFWGQVAFNPEFFKLLFNFLYIGFSLNLGLAFFNLIPIPPLDGSRIVSYFLRGRAAEFYYQLEQYGFLLLFSFLLLFRNHLSYYLSNLIYNLFIIIALA